MKIWRTKIIRNIHTYIAILVVIDGVVNIGSALFPAFPSRFRLLHDLFSISLILDAQTAAVVFGLLLIILSVGIEGRRKRAMQIVLALLLLECVANLLKGLDFEETALSAGTALLLYVNKKLFFVTSPAVSFNKVFQTILSTFILFYSYVFAGFFLLQHRITPSISFLTILEEPFQLILGDPYFHYMRRQANWFAGSIVVIGSLTIFYVVIQLIRPLIPKFVPTDEEKDKVEKLLQNYGTDSLSYFSLQDDRKYYFNLNNNAFLSYRIWHNVVVVAGDPIGPKKFARPLIINFIKEMNSFGMSVGFLSISNAYNDVYKSLGYMVMKVGEEAVIDLKKFKFDKLDKKVRRAFTYVYDHEIVMQSYKRSEIPSEILTQANMIYDNWMEQKGGLQAFTMGLGRFPNERDKDVEFICAIKNRELLGFLIMMPVYDGRSWSLDTMPRRKFVINGLNEFLIISAVKMYKARGFRKISLNFSTFSDSQGEISTLFIKQAQQLLFHNASYIYQLKSLYKFNKKFLPLWNSRYVAYPDKRSIPKVSLAFIQSERPMVISNLLPINFLKQRWIRLYN